MHNDSHLVWVVFSSRDITLPETLGLKRCRLASQPLHSMLRKALRSVFVIVLLFSVLTQLRNSGHP